VKLAVPRFQWLHCISKEVRHVRLEIFCLVKEISRLRPGSRVDAEGCRPVCFSGLATLISLWGDHTLLHLRFVLLIDCVAIDRPADFWQATMGGGCGPFNSRIKNARKARDTVIRNARKRAGVKERAKRDRQLVSGIRTGKSKRRQVRKKLKKLRQKLAAGLLDTEMADSTMKELPAGQSKDESTPTQT
jgi:hypothetical protein